MKDVCPDLVAFLQNDGSVTFRSAEDVSVKLLDRVVPEKQLFDACVSRSYHPRLFDRASKTVSIEELKDKIFHELALAELTEVVVETSHNDHAVIYGLSTSSLVIVDGKQEVGHLLRSLSLADVESLRLLVVLNSSFAEASAVVNQLFGSPSLNFLLRVTEAP